MFLLHYFIIAHLLPPKTPSYKAMFQSIRNTFAIHQVYAPYVDDIVLKALRNLIEQYAFGCMNSAGVESFATNNTCHLF
jgi:hypothetical protein